MTRQERAAIAAAVRAPLPAGFRGIHASWIEAALVELPPRTRDDLASATLDAVAVWLVRWATATLAPLPAIDVTKPRSIVEATRMTGESFVAWLTATGREQLAFAVGQTTRDGLGTRRAAIARAKLDGPARFDLIGARAIAPYTDSAIRRTLVMRLPRTHGLEVLFELRTWADQPLDASPTWEALCR
jgi:hypothetical protein